MTIDTLGYVKRLEAAGGSREQAEAHALALRDAFAARDARASPPAPQLATKLNLDRLILKHTALIILVIIAGGVLLHFNH